MQGALARVVAEIDDVNFGRRNVTIPSPKRNGDTAVCMRYSNFIRGSSVQYDVWIPPRKKFLQLFGAVRDRISAVRFIWPRPPQGLHFDKDR